MPTPRILCFAGSLRTGSFNKKLARLAAAAARQAGAEVTELDIRDYPLPLYDGDLEASDGLPPSARRLKDAFLAHQGLILACPEYNSGISGPLKNLIDWVSRPVQGQPALAEYLGKVALLIAASTGVLGGLRGLLQVRMILSNIHVLVLPEQLTIPKADAAFDESGALKDASLQERLSKITAKLITTAGKLNA
jgi:NAD(P)H-dependent FMN reductase